MLPVITIIDEYNKLKKKFLSKNFTFDLAVIRLINVEIIKLLS